MIWFTCKQCGKTHGRAESMIGTLVFCTCGQGNTVPWESTAEPAPNPPTAVAPLLEPVTFASEPAVEPDKRPRSRRGRPRDRDPATCLNHDGVASAAACSACGEGFCGDCLVYVQAEPLCGPCKNFRVRALHQSLPLSQLALVSLLLALFTGPLAFCLFPMGTNYGAHKLSLLALIPQLLAIVLGTLALRRIERSQLGGQALAVSGILTGAFAVCWTVFLTFYAARLWV